MADLAERVSALATDIMKENSDRAIRVTAGTVTLKLTLTPKLLKKSFSDAVLSPFIKAYNKKMGTTWVVDDLVSVTVDTDLVTDLSVPAKFVLLAGTTVEAELMFRVVKDQETVLPGPFSGSKWEAPKGGEVEFIQHEDDRSEIEKLKAERRKKREEREAAGASTDAPAASAEAAPPSKADDSLPIHDMTDDVGSRDVLGHYDAAAGAAALKSLDGAEASLVSVEAELGALKTMVEEALEDVEPEDDLQEAQKRLAKALKELGRLTQAMDEVELGAVDGDARAEARARKKRVMAKLEEGLLPEANALQMGLKFYLTGEGEP